MSVIIPAGSQVTVTIGRNVGDVPMHDGRWGSFIIDVFAAVKSVCGLAMSFGPFFGEGEWEGVREESSVRIFVTSLSAPAEELEALLGQLAAEYQQDAIAWSFGPNQLALPVHAANDWN